MKFLADHRWAGISGITAIVGIAVVIIIAIVQAPHDAGLSGASQVSSQAITPSAGAESPTPDAPPSFQASTSPAIFYLKDLTDDMVVRRPHWVWDNEGLASIAGTPYPNSLSYEFQNCSACDESLEFIVPPGYTRLTGTFGLSDKSRHDNLINGVVYFTVYDAAGKQLVPPTRVEYPHSVPVDIPLNGQPRIRIEMSDGDNYEEFVLGDAALARS
ncbi:hypothetical protein G3T36_18000 [Diaminobutyricibacter tongyongensis]|uniref:Glycosyl hydrolase family 98 putative carbohydrate-binding module domain-containing protein n=1 Tax=Leifsonia tongyongensis TaxID=1268043 RepID=A0A6L9Y286_9MICO|nr:hypothetical protein [Diaminobutyricibacter tongyongensis]NEN07753.1 hypothetical protein [Diaminobutyricibacter tongyongensis]